MVFEENRRRNVSGAFTRPGVRTSRQLYSPDFYVAVVPSLGRTNLFKLMRIWRNGWFQGVHGHRQNGE